MIVALSDAVPGTNDGRAFAGASDRALMTLTMLFRELGLVTRAEVEELELRVSQLEHRLRLLEAESEARPQL